MRFGLGLNPKTAAGAAVAGTRAIRDDALWEIDRHSGLEALGSELVAIALVMVMRERS